MEFDTLLNTLQSSLGNQLPAIFGALAILALGWILAVMARAATTRLLSVVKLNQRVKESIGQELGLERGAALGVFWLILLVTLVAVFNVLDLQSVSGPFSVLVGQIVGYLPHLLAGIILTLVAWLAATILRALVKKGLAVTTLDDRLTSEAGMEPMSRHLGDVAFWLVILLFLPAVLSAFQLTGLLEPVQGMVDQMLNKLPQVFGAIIIAFVGWLVATILRTLVGNLLQAAGADQFGGRIGLMETVRLSRLAGTVVFILVFVPSLIAALEAVQIEAISGPATDMLRQFFLAVPNILAAVVILMLTYYVARLAAGLVSRLLEGVGTDQLPARLGFSHAFQGELTLSRGAGKLLVFFAMLFATVEAANRLGFTQVRDVVTLFIEFGGDVLLGGVILVVGFWLANLAYHAIDQASGPRTAGLASIARGAILGLVLAMGLRAMGIADDIVNLAFGLTLGAIAVAVALSFGLGGRQAAGKQMEYWLSRWRGEG